MRIDHPCSEIERRQVLVGQVNQEWPIIAAEYGQPPLPAAPIGNPTRELQQEIYDFEPAVLDRLARANERLGNAGFPPVQLKRLTEEVEKITNDPTLSDKEKKSRIESVRKRLGLTKGEMKALVTGRLKKIYGAALSRLAEYKRVNGSDAALDSLERRLTATRSLYKNLYPSFWSRVGGFFKKVFSNVLKSLGRWFPPLVLQAIPGLGTFLGAIFPALGKAIEIGKGIFKGVMHVVRTVKETYKELKTDFEEIWRLGKQL